MAISKKFWAAAFWISVLYPTFQYFLSGYYYSSLGASLLPAHVITSIFILFISVNLHDHFEKSDDLDLIKASQTLSVTITIISISIILSSYLYIPMEFFEGHLDSGYIAQIHAIISKLNYYLDLFLLSCPVIVAFKYYRLNKNIVA